MDNLTLYGADARIFDQAAAYPGEEPARVISQYRGMYRLITAQGECLAEISGALRHEIADPAGYPAVGDFVMCGNGGKIIHRVLPRRSLFSRRAVDGGGEQIIAANIDTIFLCMSLNENYSLSRMERYLTVAWSSGATPVAVLTKADLCPDVAVVIAQIEDVSPGVDVVAVSAFDDTAAALQRWLTPGKTVSFVGSSGVGKSTLINALAGEALLETGEIRSDGKGRHTTTRRDMLALSSGALVIDTPGMREFGADSADTAKSFADIDALAARCRFSDCTHTGEPGCAVRQAIAAGELDQRRLENYRKLRREAKYDGLSFRELENEKLTSMFGQVGGMKKVRKYIRDNDKRKG